MSALKQAIVLRESDSVAVAVEDTAAGEALRLGGAQQGDRTVVAREAIPRGHKIALADMAKGQPVLKYGLSIGVMQDGVAAGSWIHSHNLASGLHGTIAYQPPQSQYRWEGEAAAAKLVREAAIPQTFMGYRRSNGTVGIRNEIWVIPAVGCVNKTAERLAEYGRHSLGLECYAYTHPFGCSQLGDDLTTTGLILSRLAQHPNAAGVVVVSLGCENLRQGIFKEQLGDYDPARIRFLGLQESEDEVAEGQRYLQELGAYAAAQKREPLPLSELVIGIKCGGSDGFSGISANPLVGKVTELVVAAGGSALQTEVPEMFGAETEVMARACSTEVFNKTVAMVNGFKDYFIAHGQEVYENPSPGNKDGGITTLEEKSLGCIRKGGAVPVADVIPYGSTRTKKGLTLVSGPGNDLVSTTCLSAAGAQMILFTTGRGTPFGAPAPTLKISSNSVLAARKLSWIDFNAGVLLEGQSFEAAGVDLLKLIIATANGQPTKSELSGNRDIAIFKDGVIL